MFLVILLFLLFGSTFTIGKAAMAYAPFMYALGIRMVIGGGLLLAYIHFFDGKRWKFERRDLVAFLQLTLFHVCLTFVPEFWAMQYVSSAKACLLFNLSPFITALFSYFFLSERMNKMKWLGLGIGLSGFIPVLLAQAPQEATSFNSVLGISLPELAVIVAVFSASYAWILIKRQVKKGYSPLMLNGIAMTWGGLLILATSFITEGAPSTSCCLASNDTIGTYFSHLVGSSEIGLYMFVFYTTLMVIVANFICYNLYGYLLRKYSATFLSFAGLTTPLFTALSGWLLLGEAVNTSFYLSICITFWGLFIFYKQEGKTSVA